MMEQDNQQWRAQIYALLASLFAAPPEQGLLQNIAALKVTDADSAMGVAWQQLCDTAARSEANKVADEYQDLFIGITQGEVIPYGSYYQSGFLHEKPLVKLRTDLAHLGLERQQGTAEPEDHIAAECDVMRLILSAEGSPVVDAMTFFQRHMQPWVSLFATDLQQANSASFYRPVAHLAQIFFAEEAKGG